MKELNEVEFTTYDFDEMKSYSTFIVYKDNGDNIEFYGAFESEQNAIDVMNALNGDSSLYEMINYFIDTDSCVNAYPHIDTIHFVYGISDMAGLVPCGSFAATNTEDGERAASDCARKFDDLLGGDTLPVFTGMKMRITQIPFFQDPNRKSQALA